MSTSLEHGGVRPLFGCGGFSGLTCENQFLISASQLGFESGIQTLLGQGILNFIDVLLQSLEGC